MATPLPKNSAFDRAARSTRDRFQNFSRKFEKQPKPLNASGIASLPPALGTHGGDYVPPAQTNGNLAGQQHTNGLTHGNNANEKDEDDEDDMGASPMGDSRMSTSTSSSIPNIRPPTHRSKRRFLKIFASSKNFKLPDLPWLCGTWHVTHSSVPVWREAKNLKVTYTRMTNAGRLDDVIQYQPRNDNTGRVERVRGIDIINRDGSYSWKGKGKLTTGAIASSRWEVLGWGGGGSKAAMENDPERNEQWLITYFAKTMFTPAGVSICSRGRTGLTDRTLRKLIKGLRKVDKTMIKEQRGGQIVDGKGDFGRMLDGMVAIPQDSAEVGIVQGQLPPGIHVK